MNWSTVKLIFRRELRDQMRDRRTLFTVAILPLLLYPVMGMALLQVAQFMREHPTQVWLIGVDNLPDDSSEMQLLHDGPKVNARWCTGLSPDLINIHLSKDTDEQFFALIREFKNPDSKNERGEKLFDQLIQQEMRNRDIDLTVVIPSKMTSDQETLQCDDQSNRPPPSVYVFQNSASDKSNIASERFAGILRNWQRAMASSKLTEEQVAAVSAKPFKIARADVANKTEKQAAAWSKILPFIIMIWSLTGAFYPAVDLCAGEKERGTFETLLSSPAHRTDLAIGKLLTVMAFSIATSILNLLSMGFTGMFVYSKMAGSAGGMAAAMGPPPLAAIGWLLVALIPISALFSGMALAAAAFARSSKEGQYYLIPLMMVCMPLMMIPMLPAAKLDIGTSLIPISGLMLTLRCLIEGQYSEVARFAGPVCLVTLVCCWLAIRWVVQQFNSETVLFRASERFGVGAWFKQVMQDRHDLPTVGNAVLLGITILLIKFFISFAMQAPGSWFGFAKQTVIVLVATVAMPAILMALILTRNAAKSLRLSRCRVPVASAAILAAIFLHPLVMWFTTLVMYVYPPSGDLMQLQQVVGTILADAPNIWVILLVFAVAPAIMEELAFRGFMLSGFESFRNKWTAVIATSLLFGLAHGVLQQSIITFFVGMILGWIAIRTKSLLPCVLYHATHNGLTVCISMITAGHIQNSFWLGAIFTTTDGSTYQYGVLSGILMSIVGLLLLFWLFKGSYHNVAKTGSGFDWSRLGTQAVQTK